MKCRIALGLSILVLALAVLSCNLPWEEEPTPVGVTVTDVIETPTETETEPPTVTETTTATFTATEDPAASLPVFLGPVIRHVAMFTPMKGWGVTQDGDYLLLTLDGGATWLDATPAGLHPLPAGLTTFGILPFFLDETTAWFSPNTTGAGMLYHTQDGGLNWTTTALPFDNARYFFLTLNNGYALVDLGAGAGSHYVALYRTVDGGDTWAEVFTHEPGESKSLPESGSKSGITFLDMNTGWVGGTIPMTDHFYFYMTTDGGATWTQETDISLPAPYAGSFLEVWPPFFVNTSVGILPVRAMASDSTMRLLIYRSTDGGQTWTFQNAVQDGRAVDFHSIDGGWVAAGTDLYQTVDGGATWTPVPGAGIPLGEGILAVDFVDGQHGWVIATPDESTLIPLKLYVTIDGGANWNQLLP